MAEGGTLDGQVVFPVYEQRLIEGSEFSVNKVLAWNSELALPRTTFTLNISGRERESLTTHRIDEFINASFNISRKVSGVSDVKLSATFEHQQNDKRNLTTTGQEDYYRLTTASYERKLASTLSSTIGMQYLDRNSTDLSRTYNETRVFVNITKDF